MRDGEVAPIAEVLNWEERGLQSTPSQGEASTSPPSEVK